MAYQTFRNRLAAKTGPLMHKDGASNAFYEDDLDAWNQARLKPVLSEGGDSSDAASESRTASWYNASAAISPNRFQAASDGSDGVVSVMGESVSAVAS
ncbi:MAG: hypothetical protein LBE05_05930 [Microbacterium sp.]|jgi:hypothetical protein|nr:hypothetical protein [Microbacterium sp.]